MVRLSLRLFRAGANRPLLACILICNTHKYMHSSMSESSLWTLEKDIHIISTSTSRSALRKALKGGSSSNKSEFVELEHAGDNVRKKIALEVHYEITEHILLEIIKILLVEKASHMVIYRCIYITMCITLLVELFVFSSSLF